VAAWETVQVQIETERVRDMERRMTPRKAGVRRIRPESYSFRWNLTYADLLREKNIIRSLKSTDEVVLKNRAAIFAFFFLSFNFVPKSSAIAVKISFLKSQTLGPIPPRPGNCTHAIPWSAQAGER